MKAIGCEIFGGSQTIGHIQTGWDVDRVLEMTDDMRYNNSYHFIKNYPDIPIIDFSEWYNEEYLKDLQGKYDLLFANNPCSGLSSINRNASVDKDVNKHFYEVLFAIENIKPKSFLIENAPTLVNLGLPILKDIQLKLSNEYKLIIINDMAGNHNVAMPRRRTMIFGFRRDYFNNKIANLESCKQDLFTVGQAFEGLTKDTPNMEFDKKIVDENFMRLYYLVQPGVSIMTTLADRLDEIKNLLTEEEYNKVLKFKTRRDEKRSVWEKSSVRIPIDGHALSLASVIQLMHPTENRDLYIREYARLMGYPDDFIFYPDDCPLTMIQCIAQGVPVNFIKYASNEIVKAFNGNLIETEYDVLYINQCNGIQKKTEFTTNEFQSCEKIDRKKDNIREESLWQ